MTNPLWTGQAIRAATGGRVVGTLPDAVTGVSIDSRSLVPGDAFFAIAGERLDGHAFVAAALKAGAALAVVSADRAPELGDAAPLVVVPDVLEALRALGRAARARAEAKIAAVTGSVGKTGSKEMLRLVLGSAGETHASAASFNNHWGVPLTLARLPAAAAFAVFEIGMNHAGEITPLVGLVKPHVAIITTVEPVHLEFFPSVEAIADAKAEIMSGLVEGGTVVLNRDNGQYGRLAAKAKASGVKAMSFGVHPGADARLLTHAALPERSVVTAAIAGTEIVYTLGAPGRHLVQNSLGVLLAAKLLGVDVKAAADALQAFRAPPGRGERHVLPVGAGQAILLDESYNANPASMRAALELLGATTVVAGGRRIAVLGDMLELGPGAELLHRTLARVVLENRIDLVFAAGPLMRALYNALPVQRRGGWAPTSADLEPRLLAAIGRGDAVMVKGSLGSRMGPLVKALIRHFAGATASGDNAA
ncbi:MAG TPA: UDP-N-acetylmuramoylalanyl-D-glutamyl-2,6-diaminopimelate--D-alanyl-D-alanine ligase [Hyphomicrobiales bacterium]|nr:UDP-N-acetylmuramoylalanyl-D-glutamyl-2,6-diaminopimelate--D-alanyl-D-alanine ligase [Hyphomicrobiales bacterium]